MNVICHQAAAVGVGQSMYEIRHYVEVNTMGAANLLHIIANEEHDIERTLVASSMSIYGEGKYLCDECGVQFPELRPLSQLMKHEWEMKCPQCGRDMKPLSCDEFKPLHPTSIYAITKRDHEEMFLTVGRAYDIPTIALRYFNTYGPRQALSNPYTGVGAIFSARLLNDEPPLIFEDGHQCRDFIHVSDIVQANILALENGQMEYGTFNIGTGRRTSVLAVARILSEKLRKDIEPQVLYQFREGDIRHCFAEISRAKEELGFEPRVDLEDGLGDLVDWVRHEMTRDSVEVANEELLARGLIK